jgi:uncharacterized protein (DUF2249 family)
VAWDAGEWQNEARQDHGDEVLDVRDLSPANRHEIVLARVASLAYGRSLVLLSDHEPKPLREWLEDLLPGDYEWSYMAKGPELWRVRVRRAQEIP